MIALIKLYLQAAVVLLVLYIVTYVLFAIS